MKQRVGKTKDKKAVREQIMRSAIASFRIEGITIPRDVALETLKKIEVSLEK